MTVSSDNKSINIPEQHYVGFNKRGEDEIPLGFMTPDGTDAAALKRKQTVDDWAARSYYGSKAVKLPAQTFTNKPLSGFKFGSSVRHGGGWGQGNVKWRIEDPRGFELEISSPNLQQIMEITTIEKGEILDKCVWGRLGSENILIPISSEVYQTALANTARLNTTASLKDLEIGYNVVLQNGVEGRYLGAHYEITHHLLEVKVSSKKKHFVEVNTDGKIKYETMSTLKLSSITPGTKLTIDEAERHINKILNDNLDARGYTNLRVSHKPLKDLTYFTRPGDPKDPTTFDDVMLVKYQDQVGFTQTYYLKYNHSNNMHVTNLDLDALLERGEVTTFTEYRSGYYSSYSPRTRTFNIDKTDPSLVWQTLGYTARTGSGDTIEVIL